MRYSYSVKFSKELITLGQTLAYYWKTYCLVSCYFVNAKWYIICYVLAMACFFNGLT